MFWQAFKRKWAHITIIPSGCYDARPPSLIRQTDGSLIGCGETSRAFGDNGVGILQTPDGNPAAVGTAIEIPALALSVSLDEYRLCSKTRPARSRRENLGSRADCR